MKMESDKIWTKQINVNFIREDIRLRNGSTKTSKGGKNQKYAFNFENNQSKLVKTITKQLGLLKRLLKRLI